MARPYTVLSTDYASKNEVSTAAAPKMKKPRVTCTTFVSFRDSIDSAWLLKRFV